MPIPSRIAVDGPSAAGKSVIGQGLARRLGYLYLDTGAMYRAVTWLALKEAVGLHDEEGLTRLAQSYPIDIQLSTVSDGRQYTVLVDGEDVTWSIRTPEVEANVSPVSAVPGVRRALVAQQRQIGDKGEVVMVGRDIGTVVMPDADLKIFLVASAEERARRRCEEIMARGQNARIEDVMAAIIRRDKIDSERVDSPLKPASDAVIVDTDGLSIEEVLERVLTMAGGLE